MLAKKIPVARADVIIPHTVFLLLSLDIKIEMDQLDIRKIQPKIIQIVAALMIFVLSIKKIRFPDPFAFH